MAGPELPHYVGADRPLQVDGDTSDQKPIYQTHRGKLPEGHDDKRPVLPRSDDPLHYQ